MSTFANKKESGERSALRGWPARVVATLLVIGALIGAAQYVTAAFDEQAAVHVKDADIESGTLAIGTHLIHISALTGELYDRANESASASGQTEVYYKSELADGTWFDITSASSLADITTGGKPVTADVIEALFFEYKTGSDGKTIDLRTGKSVNPFDVPDPYDLWNLDELKPLKSQYDMLKETQADSKAGKAKIARLEQVFNTNVKNTVTNTADSALSALQKYVDRLNASEEDKANEVGAVQKVMAAVDATRRAEVFKQLDPVLQTYIQELATVTDPASEDEEALDTSDTTLSSAASDSLDNVQQSQLKHEANMLAEGTTIASSLQYGYSQSLITDAKASSWDACDIDTANLICLGNVQDGNVSDKKKELALLDETLISRATEKYRAALSAGENEEYRKEKAAQSADALLKSIADAAGSEANALRSELEFYIEAKTLRQTPQEGIDFTEERLTQAAGYYADPPKDAFASGMTASVDAHIEFLTQLKQKLIAAAGGSELDKLLADKSALQDQRKSALDKNDLTGAQNLQNQIDALDNQIDGLQKEASDRISELQDAISKETDPSKLAKLKAELADAAAGLSDGSLAGLVLKLKKDCLEIIADDGRTDEDLSRLLQNIHTLGGMLPSDTELILGALKEIYAAEIDKRDLEGVTVLDEAIDVTEYYILQGLAMLRDSKSADELAGIAGDFLAGLTGLSGDELAAIYLLAFQMYYDNTQNEAALTLIASMAQQQRDLANPLVFLKLDDLTAEYLPLRAAAALTKMRTVWNKNKNTGTLARGGDYYIFTVYSDQVGRDKDGKKFETMRQPAKYQTDVYIPEEYAYASVGVETAYLTRTQCGVAYNDMIRGYAEELLALLLA